MNNIFLMPVNALSLSLCVLLGRSGIDVKGFFDNNADLNGKNFRGVPISLPAKDADMVVVCSYRQVAITPQLESMKIGVCQYYEYCQEDDISDLLDIFNNISAEELKDISPLCVQMKAYGEKIIKNAFIQDAGLVINALNVCITQKCNLNCVDCSFLRPYLIHPITYTTDRILSGFDVMVKNVSYIREALVIGGEPFLHKDVDIITKHIHQSEKVGCVFIISNGAVLPTGKTIGNLKGLDKLTVKISDYGELSKYKHEISERCGENGVKCVIQEQMPWWGGGALTVPANEFETEQTYKNCNMNCALLADNLFSKCSAAVWRHLLNAIPPIEWADNTCLDVYALDFEEKLREHMSSKRPLKACSVCSGKSRTVKQIEAAIQTDRCLSYKKYE
jgi:hypothetical protein